LAFQRPVTVDGWGVDEATEGVGPRGADSGGADYGGADIGGTGTSGFAGRNSDSGDAVRPRCLARLQQHQ
ncbi:unnamed protein product, partial [Closterium sp. NIES-54]